MNDLIWNQRGHENPIEQNVFNCMKSCKSVVFGYRTDCSSTTFITFLFRISWNINSASSLTRFEDSNHELVEQSIGDPQCILHYRGSPNSKYLNQLGHLTELGPIKTLLAPIHWFQAKVLRINRCSPSKEILPLSDSCTMLVWQYTQHVWWLQPDWSSRPLHLSWSHSVRINQPISVR